MTTKIGSRTRGSIYSLEVETVRIAITIIAKSILETDSLLFVDRLKMLTISIDSAIERPSMVAEPNWKSVMGINNNDNVNNPG